MFLLAKRNIKLYFRDRTAVLFSLLAVVITLLLYILFLGDMMANSMEQAGISEAKLFVQTFTMANILAVTSFTTTLGAFGLMVEDRKLKISKDFYTSPLKAEAIVAGYSLSAYLIGLIMSLIVFAVSQLYLLTLGGVALGLSQILQVLGILVISNAMNTAILAFVVSFIKTPSAFSGLSTVVGTLIGFLTGIYVPVGNLPETVQQVIKFFPVSQTATLYRQIMMEQVMDDAFTNIPANIVTMIKEELGIIFNVNGTLFTQQTHLLIIGGSLLVFATLAFFRLRKMRLD